MRTETRHVTPSALTVKQTTADTTLSRNTLYRMIARGELKTVKVGGRRLIPANEVQRLLTVAP